MLGKLNRYVTRVGIFLIAAALIAGTVGCSCDGYNPPPSQNLEIRTWYDLDAVRNNLEGNHILMNDLDSTTRGYAELASPAANGGKGWQPIGYSDPYQTHAFSGTFDGHGHEIRGLFIDRPDENGIGLFYATLQDGVIKYFGVTNVTVTGAGYVGGLVGSNTGSVINVYCSGNVTGDDRVGSLAGSSGGSVFNCYSSTNVTGTSSVGGLVGANLGSVKDSHSTGSVIGLNNVGGLVGYSHYGTVSNSYSTSNVTGYSDIGGLVGRNRDTLSNSHSTGNVTGDNSVGGLVGANLGTVSNSCWDIQTSGQATSDGGTGKNTTEMQDIATFTGAGWNIIAVGGSSERNPAYIWNIVNGATYPFLSWEA